MLDGLSWGVWGAWALLSLAAFGVIEGLSLASEKDHLQPLTRHLQWIFRAKKRPVWQKQLGIAGFLGLCLTFTTWGVLHLFA